MTSLGSARAARWVALLALAVWGAVSLPLLAGQRTLLARDVFSTHFQLKAFGARELQQGRIPALEPEWALGQPYRGNPNASAFYPGNLLYLALPFWSAFNAHFVLHWLLALFAMRALGRALGMEEASAFLAALSYAAGGWVLSALTFYNLVVLAAWWPWALWGAVRGGRRGIAVGGIACGMALLGGEPVSAALGVVPLVVFAAEGRGWWGATRTAVTIGVVGCAIASPQIVATARVIGFTFRGSHGLIVGASRDAWPLVRALEALLPLPFGWPWHVDGRGFWGWRWVPALPLISTL
ncbi:MAG TPA: hypothetical protein VIX40_05390, partial [Methylomirabilota bacterium]